MDHAMQTPPALPALSAAPRGRRPFAWTEYLAWALVLLTITASVILTAIEKSRDKQSDSGFQLQIPARYAVGVHEWMSGLPGTAAHDTANKLVEDITASAKKPCDRLRAAMLEGEILGKEKAAAHARALRRDNPALRDDADTLLGIYGDGPPPGPERLKQFHDRYGWFAQLAQSIGKPASDPQRAAALSAAQRTVIAMVSVLILFLVGTSAGFVLLIVGLILLLRKKLTLRFQTRSPEGAPLDRRVYLEAFTIYLLCMLFLGFLLRRVLGLPFGIAVLSLPLSFGLAVAWPFLRGQSLPQVLQATGLHAGNRGPGGIAQELFFGLLGYLAGLPLIALGIALTLLLVRISGADPSHPLSEELGNNKIGLLLALLLASAWAPFTEELMFRGMLFAHLRERLSWWISAPVVAFIFAIIHPQGWAAVPVLGAIAIVFAGIREWRGSVLGAMAAHAVHNGVAVVLTILLFS